MAEEQPIKPVIPQHSPEPALLGAALHQGKVPCQTDLPVVLVVEDNRLNSELVRLFLKEFCCMDFARSGEEAICMAHLKNYDAIIMDINLGPGMNGLQATQVIRTLNGFGETPVVAVTGYAMDAEKEQILEAGCTHFVSKPIEKNSFTALVRSILEKE